MILIKVIGARELTQDDPALWGPADHQFNVAEIPLPGEIIIMNGGIPYSVTERTWFLNDRDSNGNWVPGYTETVHVHVKEFRPQSQEKEDRTAAARQVFHDRINALHLDAGKPSVRRIAARIGGYSHTSVYECLAGRRLVSHDIAMAVVGALGGDTDEFHSLWCQAKG